MPTEFLQQPGVHDAPGQAEPATGGAYAPRGGVDDGTFEVIRQANGAFLALVARRCAGHRTASALGVHAAVAERIAAQDATTRRLASECPYTLFNLRFEDAAFWRRLPAVDRIEAPSDEDSRFVLTAVFLAWHLARCGDLSAPLALGMAPAVHEVWRNLPLHGLEAAAAVSLPHLQARWGGHPRFWPLLLDAAEHPGVDHAERVRLLGLQLLATDGCRTTLPRRRR